MAGKARLIAPLLGLALLCQAQPAWAQSRGGPWKIGVLWDTRTVPPRLIPLSDWFLQDLKAHGFAEKDFQLVVRQVEEAERLRDGARDLAKAQVHLIWAPTSAAAVAAKAETREIPIVFGLATDPVQLGLVERLSRPGGNVTGIMTQPDLLAAKRLEILKEIVPRLRRVGVAVDPSYVITAAVLEKVREAAPKLSVTLVELPVTSPGDIERLAENLKRERVDGMLHIVNPTANQHFEATFRAVNRAKLPDIGYYLPVVEQGLSLAAYGPNYREIWRASARHVAKILRGTKPQDIPVESNDVIELYINLNVAKERGIQIPAEVIRFRAHKVFE